MTYGRLDVFWPDGKFESYTLETPSVSIGRSTGNTVTLDTDTISRYHFSITQDGDQIHITDMDSANGTFVDGERLVSNQQRQLMGGEEIQIGHLRIIYHMVNDNPTLPMAAVEDTQRIEREAADFRINVYGPEIDVPPGSHTSAEVTITNTQSKPRRFVVKATGLPEGWLRVNRPELEIDPGESASVQFSIKPARRSDSQPGDYPVRITVTPKDDPEGGVEAEIIVRILSYSGFGMALASSRLISGQLFRLHMHNQGSDRLPLYVSARSVGNALMFGIATPQMVLAPGQRTVLQGEIKPRRARIFGAPREYPFYLEVRSRDEAGFLVSVPGTFTESPSLPGWAALTVGGLALSVIALVILALVLLVGDSKGDPQILGFDARPELVLRGEPLTVTWSVRDASHVNININGLRTFSNISPQSTGIEIDTTGFTPGTTVIVLEAVRGGRSVTDAITVSVAAQMILDYFEVVPSTLLRNVVQSITIRWNVSGAASTRVNGLQDFSTTALETSYGPEGTAQVAGIAGNNLTLTLHAENSAGVVLEQSTTVLVIDPVCRAAGPDDLTLYAGPDSLSNVISTVRPNTTLVVDRRDASGAWVRAQLAGGVAGWGARAGFACDNFNVDDLLTEVSPPAAVSPQPTPSPPPQPGSPTPTPRTGG